MNRYPALFMAALGLSAMSTSRPAKAAEAPTANILLDTDIGDDIDDAYAVALLTSTPNIKIVGVTTAYGETNKRAQLAAKLLKTFGRPDVPVAAGQAGTAKIGRQYEWCRGYTSKAIRKEPAVEFMKREIDRAPGQITLVAIGALTNVGELITRYPETARKLKAISIMGGAVHVGYNNQPPATPEWNIRCDPAAAKMVYASGIPLTMAGLEVTTMMQLDAERQKRVFAHGSPGTDALAALTALWGGGTPTLYDPVALAFALGHPFSGQEAEPIEVNGEGLTSIGTGTNKVTVLVNPRKDEFLDWYVNTVVTARP